MAISINTQIHGGVTNLSSQINKAIHSAIKTSLCAIRDKWQTEMQYVLKSNSPVYLAGGNPIQYPMDSSGFSGMIVLPELVAEGSMALNIKRDTLPALSTTRSISSVFLGNTKKTYITPRDIYSLHNKLKVQQTVYPNRVTPQRKGLQHIVEGYHKKPKTKDPLKALSQRLKSTIGANKLMPFAQVTFVDALNSSLNGLS